MNTYTVLLIWTIHIILAISRGFMFVTSIKTKTRSYYRPNQGQITIGSARGPLRKFPKTLDPENTPDPAPCFCDLIVLITPCGAGWSSGHVTIRKSGGIEHPPGRHRSPECSSLSYYVHVRGGLASQVTSARTEAVSE